MRNCAPGRCGAFLLAGVHIVQTGLGEFLSTSIPGSIRIGHTFDGAFSTLRDGVTDVARTADGKIEFVAFGSRIFAYVRSELGYPALYPFYEARLETPLRAVLMDLDGTTVHSEEFWMWIIQKSMASLMGNHAFELEEADLPFVSGHSVSEHLSYCIRKYCPDAPLSTARTFYFEHTEREMRAIMDGVGRANAFTPAPGVGEFLKELKAMGVKIALVTSGLYEKAFPEILSAFRTLDMGDPRDFYDCIITAGFPLKRGAPGTLGELSPKPHPWLYAEACAVGLGIPFAERSHVVGIEDSGAGIASLRLAGFSAIGIRGGNIVESGVRGMCGAFCDGFEDILAILKTGDMT